MEKEQTNALPGPCPCIPRIEALETLAQEQGRLLNELTAKIRNAAVIIYGDLNEFLSAESFDEFSVQEVPIETTESESVPVVKQKEGTKDCGMQNDDIGVGSTSDPIKTTEAAATSGGGGNSGMVNNSSSIQPDSSGQIDSNAHAEDDFQVEPGFKTCRKCGLQMLASENPKRHTASECKIINQIRETNFF